MGSPSILLITDTLCDANGVSRFIQDVSLVAKKKNYKFYAITATKKDYCQKSENIIRLKPFLSFKMPFYPELDLAIPPILKLYKLIKEINPDIIHISTPGIVGFVGRAIALKLKKPIYGTYHTDFPSYVYSNTKKNFTKKFTMSFEKFFYKKFQGLFIRSDEYREILKNRFHFEDSSIFTIPAGIDISRFDPNKRDINIWENYELPKDTVKALYVGRTTKEKNLEFLFEVWKEFIKTNPKSHLILIGSGSFYNKKDDYLKDNIIFLGHRGGEELIKLYASSDFFVFPSNTDTLGQVVIEAMASNLAVLVSNQGGPKTLIEDGKEGYILEKNNHQIWLEGLEKIVKNRDELKNNALNSSKDLTIEKSFEYFWNKQVENGL